MSADFTAPAGTDAENSTQQEGDLLPVRMLNEYAYCPRLFHLMHVEGRWADNVYTVDRKYMHRRVDKLDHVIPEGSSAPENQSESEDGGIPAKLDDSHGRACAEGGKRLRGDEPPEIARAAREASASRRLMPRAMASRMLPRSTKRGLIEVSARSRWSWPPHCNGGKREVPSMKPTERFEEAFRRRASSATGDLDAIVPACD